MNNMQNLFQLMRNPQQFMQGIMANSQVMQNPMMKNAMEMYQKGDTQGLQNLVNNVATQKGTSIDEIRKQFGI